MASAVPLRADPPGDARVVLELEVPSDVALIERVVALVSGQIRQLGFSAQTCAFTVPVALSEALSNAMLRGNRDDRGKHVGLRAWIDTQYLMLDVTDEGDAFDFDGCLRDPTTAENVQREDGRGLFLMRRLMDRVERLPPTRARAGAHRGNLVRLTLRRR